MAECQDLTVEQIFSSLFTQERFYNATHIPHFLQTFAPAKVQKLSRDVQTMALLQGATLLATVAPDPVPLFDLPPLPNAKDAKSEDTYLAFSVPKQPLSNTISVSQLGNVATQHQGGTINAIKPITANQAGFSISGSYQSNAALMQGQSQADLSNSTCPAVTFSQGMQANLQVGQCTVETNTQDQQDVDVEIKIPVNHGLNAELRARHCHISTNCPFVSNINNISEFHCDYFVDGSCTCTQAWALSDDKNKCVEAVFPNVSKKVWTAAEFEDARAAVRYALDEDRVQITLCTPLRHLQHKTQLFPLDVKASVRSRLTHCYEVALYSKICVSALVERLPYLRPLMYEMMVCVENAALLHDIGRPPAGKFGEQLLCQWITEVCELYDHELSTKQQEDLKSFNSHAQGLRLAHSIYKLNLTLSQLSTLMSSQLTYSELRSKGLTVEAARDNTGLFLSEVPLRERISKSGITTRRHPLSWILEQCDDLAYILGDLDDAYDRGLLKEAEVLELIENLIAYLKDNACNSTCDRCVSACTCANGCIYPYHMGGEHMIDSFEFASNSDAAHASKHGHGYGYGVDPAERDKLHCQSKVRSAQVAASLHPTSCQAHPADTLKDSKQEVNTASRQDEGMAVQGIANGQSQVSSEGQAHAQEQAQAQVKAKSEQAQANITSHIQPSIATVEGNVEIKSHCESNGPSNAQNSRKEQATKPKDQQTQCANKKDGDKFVLGGEHEDVLAHGLTYIKLDVILVDAIKHSYCQGKQDSFGVLQLVHGTNPISLREMMQELGVRTLLSLLRECIVTYYIDDIIHAISAHQYEFFINGEINVTHYGNDAHKAIDFLKRFEQHMVYCHEDIQALELSSGQYLKYVLHEYGQILSISSLEFLNCITNNKGAPFIVRLCRRLPRRCKEAYLEQCQKDMNMERYARIRLILDFVSCMTEPFLTSEYEVLSGNMSRRI